MNKLVITCIIFTVATVLTGCKSDAPNPSPKVTFSLPSPTNKKYRINKDIPVRFTVYDKDGLSGLTYSVVAKKENVTIFSESPSVSGSDFNIDSKFQVASIMGKDSLECYFTIEATDVQGNKRTFRSPFLVKK